MVIVGAGGVMVTVTAEELAEAPLETTTEADPGAVKKAGGVCAASRAK